jgi:type IV secretory pathway TraG/TraD family ATPase VirD4
MTRRGILLGTLEGYYLTDAGDTHVALFGETRSGKDATHILPTACLWEGSMVITDPKNGITLAQTQRYRCPIGSSSSGRSPCHPTRAAVHRQR